MTTHAETRIVLGERRPVKIRDLILERVHGRDALLAYFTKLLGRNPAWVWTHRGSISLSDGFLNEWHASIPVGATTVEVDGVCTVQLRGGLIYRNMVYFDRSDLLRALAGKASL